MIPNVRTGAVIEAIAMTSGNRYATQELIEIMVLIAMMIDNATPAAVNSTPVPLNQNVTLRPCP